MAAQVLIPKRSQFFPSREIVQRSHDLVQKYGPNDFESYSDWFHFIHVDPVQRYIHTFGFLVGTPLFVMIFVDWGWLSLLYYVFGVFFFYGLGIVSHHFYDGGSAKSDPRYFHLTLWTATRINLLTLSGQYDEFLRKYVKKYPFAQVAHDLIEVPKQDVFKYLVYNSSAGFFKRLKMAGRRSRSETRATTKDNITNMPT